MKLSNHVLANLAAPIVKSLSSLRVEVTLKQLTGIQSPYCKEGNVVSSKLGAQIIIRGLLGLPIDLDSIPDPDVQAEIYPDTIVEAEHVRTMPDVEVELSVC